MNKSQLLINAHAYARELLLLDSSLPYALALKAGMQEAWKEAKTPTLDTSFWFDYTNRPLTLFWDILGLDRDTATRQDVKRAYRSLAHQVHPDHGGTSELMDQLIWAKDAALDSVVRESVTDSELEAMFGL